MKGSNSGIGPTDELSLRVSVATLARVTFPDPESGIKMVALEEKVTVIGKEGGWENVKTQVQPFGGAVTILDIERLNQIVGGFHFDSRTSQAVQDFRIFIQPDMWPVVLEHLQQVIRDQDKTLIELDPHRELEEEFEDALSMEVADSQYRAEYLKMVVEEYLDRSLQNLDLSVQTHRIYLVYSVEILDPKLIRTMIHKWKTNTSEILTKRALVDYSSGGKGWANGIFLTSLEKLRQRYKNLPVENRGGRFPFSGSFLARNVSALLDGIQVQNRYELSADCTKKE